MMQTELIGEFYTTSRKVLTQATEDQVGSRDKYLAYLESCGKHYLETMALDESHRGMLSMSVLDF